MFLSRGGHSRSYPRHDLLLFNSCFNCELVLSRNLGFGMPRGCELNVKMSITWDGIHHGTRQGDTESPKYGDLSAVWGEKVPGKALLGHPVGKWNEHVCCSRVTVPAVDLHTVRFLTAARRGD